MKTGHLHPSESSSSALCPRDGGARPPSSLAASTGGTRPAVGTDDPAVSTLVLSGIGSSDGVVSLPVSPGVHTAWPAPALPRCPSCPQGTWGYPVQPPKPAIFGEKGRRKAPGPHFGCIHQSGVARATTSASPLASFGQAGVEPPTPKGFVG